ncbi:MAG: FAD-binding protein [Eubacterium sp.]|nr:FAD-binding protein [Eubacterium sp.]
MEEVVGLTDYEIFDRVTADHFVKDDKKAIDMDEPYIFFEDVPDAVGIVIRNLQTTKMKFRDSTGRLCTLGMCVDVTQMTKIKESEARQREMEEKLGAKGNLVTRDIMSRSIYETGRDVYLDISFMNKERINEKIPEVRDLCLKYRGIDISKEPIPVAPCVHFFMGGLAVHMNHETNIRSLYAIGECASMYHGANRLGGNSLLSAIYSGMVAADDISENPKPKEDIDFSLEIEEEKEKLKQRMETKSKFPVMYIRDMLAETMNKSMGIVRTEAELDKGLSKIDYYLSIAEKLRYDNSVLAYFNYSLVGIINIAKASVSSAKARKESRGAHYRSDYPDSKDSDAYASIISYNNGEFKIRLDKEKLYES